MRLLVAAALTAIAPSVASADGPARYPYASPTFTAQRMSCEHGDARSCVEAAGYFTWSIDYDHAPLTAQQLHDRAELYARGCELGAQDGCVQLAKLLAVGDGVPKDEARARQLAGEGCRGHEPEGCVVMSQLVTDPSEVKQLLQRACDKGYYGIKKVIFTNAWIPGLAQYHAQCGAADLGMPLAPSTKDKEKEQGKGKRK